MPQHGVQQASRAHWHDTLKLVASRHLDSCDVFSRAVSRIEHPADDEIVHKRQRLVMEPPVGHQLDGRLNVKCVMEVGPSPTRLGDDARR